MLVDTEILYISSKMLSFRISYQLLYTRKHDLNSCCWNVFRNSPITYCSQFFRKNPWSNLNYLLGCCSENLYVLILIKFIVNAIVKIDFTFITNLFYGSGEIDFQIIKISDFDFNLYIFCRQIYTSTPPPKIIQQWGILK